MPRLPLAILLALLLLLSQQAAVTHALTHYADSQQHDKQAPDGKVCEKCASYAKLSSAVACAETICHLVVFTSDLPRAVLEGVAHAAFSPYLSRAPPSFS